MTSALPSLSPVLHDIYVTVLSDEEASLGVAEFWSSDRLISFTRVGSFEGSLELGDDLSTARARGTVEAASIDTKSRTATRSPSSPTSKSHPRLTFESKQIRPTGDGEFEIAGDLAMHGVTREIVLQAEIAGMGEDAYGGERVRLEVRGQLHRGDCGLKWNHVLGSGDLVAPTRSGLPSTSRRCGSKRPGRSPRGPKRLLALY